MSLAPPLTLFTSCDRDVTSEYQVVGEVTSGSFTAIPIIPTEHMVAAKAVSPKIPRTKSFCELFH
jgi:hypothetical protein